MSFVTPNSLAESRCCETLHKLGSTLHPFVKARSRPSVLFSMPLHVVKAVYLHSLAHVAIAQKNAF